MITTEAKFIYQSPANQGCILATEAGIHGGLWGIRGVATAPLQWFNKEI